MKKAFQIALNVSSVAFIAGGAKAFTDNFASYKQIETQAQKTENIKQTIKNPKLVDTCTKNNGNKSDELLR